METTELKMMKGSDIHRIIAAVMEIMEKVNIQPQVDAKLLPEKDDESIWKMDFIKKETSLDELVSIRKELGNNFKLKILAKEKNVVISVVANGADFINMMEKKLHEPLPSRNMFDSQGEQK